MNRHNERENVIAASQTRSLDAASTLAAIEASGEAIARDISKRLIKVSVAAVRLLAAP